MKNTKLTIFIFLLIFSSTYSSILVVGQDNDNETPIIDILRGLEIEFLPPRIIQDCSSKFILNVTVEKARFINIPRMFSISVFLKIKDTYGKDKIINIGSKPFVRLSPFETKKTVSIVCFTTNNLSSYLECLHQGGKSEIDIYSGSIGVKINRIAKRSFIEWIFWRTFISNDNIWKFLLYDVFPSTPEIVMRYISFYQRCSSFIRDNNHFIEWRNVSIISPFVCSERINIENIKVQEKTNKKGDFYVNITIRNDLDRDVFVSVLVDLADQKIFNNMFPTFPDIMYNVGYFEGKIEPKNIINGSIKCSFPNGYFYHKNYSITVECAPYIFIENTSQFGVYFYDVRFKNFIEPTYVVNGSVKKMIRTLWYNTPIFYGDADSASIFPNSHNSTFYNGETFIEEVTDEIIDKIEDKLGLMALFIIIFMLTSGLINWVVRKKS